MISLLMKKKAIFSVILITIAAVTSFTLVNFIFSDVAEAGSELKFSAQESIFVSSVEEASKIAGFQVATPNSELTTFADSELKYSIDVNQLVQLGTKPAPRPVGQSWELADGSMVRLLQGPGLQLPNIGEPIKIGGTIGEKIFFEAEDYMPSRIALYWTNGDIGYSLFGTLTDSISEEILISIADSVKVR